MKALTIALSAVAFLSVAAFAGGPSDPHNAIGVSGQAAGTLAPNQKLVAYGDLNLSSQEGLVALHNRIVAAAVEVCSTYAQKAARSDKQCRETAVKNAFNEVGRKFTEHLASAQ